MKEFQSRRGPVREQPEEHAGEGRTFGDRPGRLVEERDRWLVEQMRQALEKKKKRWWKFW
ncbi:zinc finger SWIM domain protein [Thermanaeromonas toyohensis ToBE]|uniref:Zinc finger SWIM domain protein n=1 Tax=Thermanaeromonas toyohensis ToBE TaxID=698762 RepID=A0A1W1VUI2_9FIRM|nr:hypothetical protein [Thermanaeromonas toyohensis]SMB97042.1 zinc finger SWIM domain protein [Thermanaeromonas toyohensis ToBE]